LLALLCLTAVQALRPSMDEDLAHQALAVDHMNISDTRSLFGHRLVETTTEPPPRSEGEFIYCRHGESTGNSLKKFKPTGWWQDGALTGNGEIHAIEAAEKLFYKERELVIKLLRTKGVRVFVSPLKRAMATAVICIIKLFHLLWDFDSYNIPTFEVVPELREKYKTLSEKPESNPTTFIGSTTEQYIDGIYTKYVAKFFGEGNERLDSILVDLFGRKNLDGGFAGGASFDAAREASGGEGWPANEPNTPEKLFRNLHEVKAKMVGKPALFMFAHSGVARFMHVAGLPYAGTDPESPATNLLNVGREVMCLDNGGYIKGKWVQEVEADKEVFPDKYAVQKKYPKLVYDHDSCPGEVSIPHPTQIGRFKVLTNVKGVKHGQFDFNPDFQEREVGQFLPPGATYKKWRLVKEKTYRRGFKLIWGYGGRKSRILTISQALITDPDTDTQNLWGVVGWLSKWGDCKGHNDIQHLKAYLYKGNDGKPDEGVPPVPHKVTLVQHLETADPTTWSLPDATEGKKSLHTIVAKWDLYAPNDLVADQDATDDLDLSGDHNEAELVPAAATDDAAFKLLQEFVETFEKTQKAVREQGHVYDGTRVRSHTHLDELEDDGTDDFTEDDTEPSDEIGTDHTSDD